MFCFTDFGGEKMKVFVSWSGELSKKIAEELNRWIPCFIQSVEIFYSQEDIEKGERWNTKVLKELEETKYGIVCLTAENCTAPWINFESGALAKNIDESRVSTLLIDLQPSAIKGPLATFQATKLHDKDDFLKLIKSINNNLEHPVEEKILITAFEAIWEKFLTSVKKVIGNNKQEEKQSGKENKEKYDSQILEEVLQLVRQQTMVLSSPELLLPKNYLASISTGNIERRNLDELFIQIIDGISEISMESQRCDIGREMLREIMMFVRENNLSKRTYVRCRNMLEKIEIIGRTMKKPNILVESVETPENFIRYAVNDRTLSKKDLEIE